VLNPNVVNDFETVTSVDVDPSGNSQR